jgi:hypothetical protein
MGRAVAEMVNHHLGCAEMLRLLHEPLDCRVGFDGIGEGLSMERRRPRHHSGKERARMAESPQHDAEGGDADALQGLRRVAGNV